MTEDDLMSAVHEYGDVYYDDNHETVEITLARAKLLEAIEAWAWGTAEKRRAAHTLLEAKAAVGVAYLARRVHSYDDPEWESADQKLCDLVADLRELEDNELDAVVREVDLLRAKAAVCDAYRAYAEATSIQGWTTSSDQQSKAETLRDAVRKLRELEAKP